VIPIAPCTHGMPSPTACTDCMFEGPVAQPTPPRPSVVFTFKAAFDGHCPACNLAIVGGLHAISELTNGSYVHEGCAT